MPPTSDAYLLRSRTSSDEQADDRGSSRSLDEVGAVTVLGAMVEQRKRTSSVPPPADDADAIATQRRDRLDPSHDVFQKIR